MSKPRQRLRDRHEEVARCEVLGLASQATAELHAQASLEGVRRKLRRRGAERLDGERGARRAEREGHDVVRGEPPANRCGPGARDEVAAQRARTESEGSTRSRKGTRQTCGVFESRGSPAPRRSASAHAYRHNRGTRWWSRPAPRRHRCGCRSRLRASRSCSRAPPRCRQTRGGRVRPRHRGPPLRACAASSSARATMVLRVTRTRVA